MEMLAVVAILAALAAGKRNSQNRSSNDSGSGFVENAPESKDVFGGIVDAGKKLGGAVGALGGKIGGAVGGAKGVATWGIPAAIAGVSTGFLVVAGLWAIALVAGIVFSALLAPEMARRGTMGRLYGATRGSFAWRLGRLYWANLFAQSRGWSVAMLRWPDIDTAWGQLNVIGFLPIVKRTGESLPGNAETMSPDDQYEVYRWPFSRETPTASVKEGVSQAHELALVYTYGLLCAVRACGIVIGEVNNYDPPPTDNFYTADGIGLISSIGVEFDGSKPPLEAQRAAWLQGIQDGCAFVRGNAWGVGGKHLLSPNDAQSVAAQLVEWQLNFVPPPNQTGKQSKFTSAGRFLQIANDEGDTVSIEIKVAP